ncbi:probable phospholipase A2 homolog 1 [Phragmites australis]|uniref:probable phospholipase A2 homolog 1 n=1 Tax=Phragmites australis TaxID=29695 RepID=UPI002D79B8EA|nr:probable phospholipase A2 homolog 1 [Phragmites australis]
MAQMASTTTPTSNETRRSVQSDPISSVRHQPNRERRPMSPRWPLLVLLLLAVLASAASAPPPPCSRSCAALNCDSVGIRYGKYCGVGWSGCDGEEPCDDLDACCRDHDHCVDKKGLMSVKCHEKLKNCMRKVKKGGKIGFSKECPYEMAMTTMTQGMDMAIMLSQLGSQKLEL